MNLLSIIFHDFIILQVSEIWFKKFLSRFIISLYIDLIYSNTRILPNNICKLEEI